MKIIIFFLLTVAPPPDDFLSKPIICEASTPAGPFSITWEYMVPIPTCAVSRTVAILGSDNKIHLICGNCPTHGSHPFDEVYDPLTNTWQRGLTYPGGGGVHNHSAVALGSKIYVGGGRQGSNFTDDLTLIDLNSNTWTIIGKMPNQGVPHYYYQFATWNGKIYMFGGIKYDTLFTDETWCYDPISNTWSVKRPMPVPKMAVCAIPIGDTIFICGGSTNYPNGTRSVYAYFCPGDTWIIKSDSMNLPTFWASGHIINTPDTGLMMFIIGGQDRSSYLNAVQKKDCRYPYWSNETPIRTARRSHGGTQKGCSLYVVCGWNGTGINSIERGRVNLIGISDFLTVNSPVKNGFSALPNPFNNNTTLHFYLQEESYIIIDLYDLTGKKIKRIFAGKRNRGEHSLNLVKASLSPGAYFLIFKNCKYTNILKLIVLG